MKTLSAELIAAQIASPRTPLVKLYLVIPVSGPSYTYYKDRIISVNPYNESIDSHNAQVVLNNNDGEFTGKDLSGARALISFGFTTTSGDEYIDRAPMWVKAQQNVSVRGRLYTILYLIGIPDLLKIDLATESYTMEAGDTQTVKDLITAILTPGLACYVYSPNYSVVYDSEDSLIDSFCPAQLFNIQQNDNRLAKVKELLNYTKCVMKYGGTGDDIDAGTYTIHILNPTISGTSYDSTYSLASDEHKFFDKQYHQLYPIPNYITVRNFDHSVSGDAVAANEARRPVRRLYDLNVADNTEADNVAAAILQQYEVGDSSGYVHVPMNCGQECWDYVDIVDSREGDERAGNVQTLVIKYASWQRLFQMEIHFGKVSDSISTNLSALFSDTSNLTANELKLFDIISQVWNYLDSLSQSVTNLINQLKTHWTINWLQVTRRLHIPRGLDADKEASPTIGMIYVATDTKKVYACFEDGTWMHIGGGTLDATPGSTTANWNSGTATSGKGGADLVTIGSDGTPTKIQSLWLSIHNIASGANVTVRGYMKVNSTEREIYNSLTNGNTFVKDLDTEGLWIFNGEICVSNAVRIEVESDQAADDGKAIDYEYLLET